MEITGSLAMRALAHPLRLDLLEFLAFAGPTTAAQCGRALGVPQANCSFHLRQLAKYGFVQEAGVGDDKRERKWQVFASTPRLRVPPGADAVVGKQLARVVVEREMAAILKGTDGNQDGSGWQQNIVSTVLVMSAAEATDVKEKFQALLKPYVERFEAGRPPRPDQQHVRYFFAATPLPHFDLGEDEQ